MLKILLIEDNPVDALIVKRAFEQLESGTFELFHVSTLAEALSCVADETYHAVLLDLDLPDSAGVESIRTLLNRIPDCPVIVLTGMNDTSVEVQGIELGAQEFLTKDEVKPLQIIRAIRHAALRKLYLMKQLAKASGDSSKLDVDALRRTIEESTRSIARCTNDLLQTELTNNQSDLVKSIEREARETLSSVRGMIGTAPPAMGDVLDDSLSN